MTCHSISIPRVSFLLVEFSFKGTMHQQTILLPTRRRTGVCHLTWSRDQRSLVAEQRPRSHQKWNYRYVILDDKRSHCGCCRTNCPFPFRAFCSWKVSLTNAKSNFVQQTMSKSRRQRYFLKAFSRSDFVLCTLLMFRFILSSTELCEACCIIIELENSRKTTSRVQLIMGVACNSTGRESNNYASSA